MALYNKMVKCLSCQHKQASRYYKKIFGVRSHLNLDFG